MNHKKRFFIRTTSFYGYGTVQLLKDYMNFSSEMGFIPFKLGISPLMFAINLLRFWSNTDIVLAIYPYIIPINRKHLFRNLEITLFKKFIQNKQLILLIIDLPIEQNLFISGGSGVDSKTLEYEKELFKCAKIICSNKNFKNLIIKKHNIQNDKFVDFEILDCSIRINMPIKYALKHNYIKIAIVMGSLSRKLIGSMINELPETNWIKYDIYGSHGEWIRKLNRKDIEYHGFLPPRNLVKRMSKENHFGMILYDLNNETITYYLKKTHTSKFTIYLVAGLPIIAPSKYDYTSELIKKYNVGVNFNSLKELPEIISEMIVNNKYTFLRNNSVKLGRKMNDGFFFKKAINCSLKKLDYTQYFME